MSEPASLNGLIDAALAISDRRCEILRNLREALDRGDDQQALVYARQLVGLENDQKGNRTNPGIN